MIFNITYPDPKKKQEIEKLAGKPYGFMERFKLGGVGSSKMIIEKASLDIAEHLDNTNDFKFCNIEIRKKGVIVGFNSSMKIFAWAIPFYELVIYHNAKQISIYSNTSHLKLRPFFNSPVDRKFILKLIEKKAEYVDSVSPPTRG